jgi:hypothetical protein
MQCAGNGFFFNAGGWPNIDDHHCAPAIDLLLELVGWF